MKLTIGAAAPAGSPSKVSGIDVGHDFTFGEKLTGFAQSTLESFPELFGIEPTKATESYRAANPVSGFVSQAVGAFVPYLGATKAVRAAPLVGSGIRAVEALGGNAFTKGALGVMAETAAVEAGRVAIGATPLPKLAYDAATGGDADTRSIGDMAGEAGVNVVAGGALGGLFGALGGRLAKGVKIEDLVPGAAPDLPLVKQIEALNDTIKRAQDPADPFTLPDDQLARLDRERAQRIKWNLQDVVPQTTDTGELGRSGKYTFQLGRVFRNLEGDKAAKGQKETSVTKFLNATNNFKAWAPDKFTENLRLIYDPLGEEAGGFANRQDLEATFAAIGKDANELGSLAQDIKSIRVKEGTGKKPMPEDYVHPLDFIRNKIGDVAPFYHGTKADIEVFKDLGGRGGVSFSTSPQFASDWVSNQSWGMGNGEKVYIAALKKSKVADFENPADVDLAMQKLGLSADSKPYVASGEWGAWENPKLFADGQWDTAYMVENPTSSNPVKRAKNIFVTKPEEQVHPYFSQQTMWAKNARMLINDPAWNKTGGKDLLLQKARVINRKYTATRVWSDVGEGWRMAKEAGDDGMFVMNKLIKGDITDPQPGDQWIQFRTARPEAFATRAAKTDKILMESAFYPKQAELDAVNEPLWQAATSMEKLLGQDILSKKGVRAKTKVGAMVRDSMEHAASYVAPTGPLATRNPLLNYGVQMFKNLEAAANSRVDTVMAGNRVFDKSKTLWRNVVTLDTPSTDGFSNRIDELLPKDLADISFVLETELPFEQVLAHNQRLDVNGDKVISDKAVETLRALQLMSDNYAGRMDELAKNLKVDPAKKLAGDFTARKGHYMITREYPGAFRLMLNDERGELVGLATGATAKEAREAAETIIASQSKRGRIVTEGGIFDEALMDAEQVQNIRTKLMRPGFLKNRGNLIGYDLQRGDLTNGKLKDLVDKNLRRRENLIRSIVAQEKLAPTIMRLEQTSPQDAQVLKKMLLLAQGDEGIFGKAQNVIMDKALAAVGISGKDSASKIVQETQKLMSTFQFGFANLTQPIQAVLGTMQTILPEAFYILNGTPEQLARNYVSLPTLNSANQVTGSMGMLSGWKVFGNAMKRMSVEMGKQEEDFQSLVYDMIKQRQLAPRFAEEQFGMNGSILAHPREAFKSGESFVELMGAANNVLISKSEELNRMMVVNTAYELAKMRGMSYPQMVHFTREMMSKTAFNYAAHDRARVFTTPLGSLGGTFKNWMFHYMANMVKYSTGGKEALPALFWQTATTGLIAGGAGVPLAMPLINGASEYFANKSGMEAIYDGVDNVGLPEQVADGLIYGIPGSMGLSLSSLMASPGSDPARDAQMIFSFATYDRMKSLSSGVKDAITAYRVTGESPWQDERVKGELVRALAPRTLYRSMALTQDLAVKSLSSGYDVSKPLGVGGALLYGLGFNPVELDKTYEVYNAIRDDQAASKATVQELGASLAEALEAGDQAAATRIYVRGTAVGLDSGKILRSAQARMKRGEQTQLDFTASDEDKQAYGFQFN